MTKKKVSIWLMTLTTVLGLLGACTERQPGASQEPTQAIAGEADKLQVYFIDVGKGDAALINLPGGHWVMVDTGPIEGFPEIGRTLIRQGITHLDAIFISHGHKDHIGGLNSVLGIAGSDIVYTIPDCMDDKEITDAKKDFDTDAETLTAGQSVKIGDAVFECLGPAGNYEDENDKSMVLMLKYKDQRLLFTGDQLAAAESGLMQSGKDLKADVLKVAYHGGAESTSSEFAKKVSPKFAVVPTDETRPPAQRTLDVLSGAGADCFVLGDTGTLLYNGEGIVKISAPEDEAPDVSVSEKDVTAEFVTITNNAEKSVDLTGWCLFSKKGSEVYFFPSGTELPPNASLNVYSGKYTLDNKDGLIWTEESIWSNKKEDVCELFDSFGRLIGSL